MQEKYVGYFLGTVHKHNKEYFYTKIYVIIIKQDFSCSVFFDCMEVCMFIVHVTRITLITYNIQLHIDIHIESILQCLWTKHNMQKT